MRGALDKVPGVSQVDVTAGQQEMTVHYDAGQTNVDAILSALKGAGESATVKK